MKIISFNHKGMDKVGVIFGKEIIDLGFALKPIIRLISKRNTYL